MEFEIPTWAELRLVMPEIWLVITMCAVILVPFIKRTSVVLPVATTFVGLGLALVSALPLLTIRSGLGQHAFGVLAIDPFSQFFKVLLILFTLFILVQWLVTSRQDTEVKDVPDYLCLLVGATFGMALMASATNLLMIFVAIESASLPSFALAGFLKRHRLSTEASLKYVLFGTVASAVGLYGMSLIYGTTGSLDLNEIARQAAGGENQIGMTVMLAVGLTAMFSSIAFKLSATPLHFWCPDVFQGAPIEVTTFLSVASKGAAVCLLLRVMTAFGAAATWAGPDISFIGLSIGVAMLGAVTATWGNLVAFHQDNIKRLLAYSSIAHAGYMIMGASLATFVDAGAPAQSLAGAILFYLVIYMFMNLGAFTVAALIRQQTGTEDIRDYTGLIRRCPTLSVLLVLFLLSLFGMPGLGGFMGKIYLGVAMFDVGKTVAFVTVAALLINTLISLYFYMRPVYYMVFTESDRPRPNIGPQPAGVLLIVICAVALLWTGILPQTIGRMTRAYGTLTTAPEVSSSLKIAAAPQESEDRGPQSTVHSPQSAQNP